MAKTFSFGKNTKVSLSLQIPRCFLVFFGRDSACCCSPPLSSCKTAAQQRPKHLAGCCGQQSPAPCPG